MEKLCQQVSLRSVTDQLPTPDFENKPSTVPAVKTIGVGTTLLNSIRKTS